MEHASLPCSNSPPMVTIQS